jgi:hypothetical protein
MIVGGMRNLRRVAATMAATALLLSTAALFDHDHAVEAQLAPRLCTVDHARAAVSGSRPGSTPELQAGAPSHPHVCVGCRLSRERTSVASPQIAQAAVDEAPRETLGRPPLPLLDGTLRGPSPRGPPLS